MAPLNCSTQKTNTVTVFALCEVTYNPVFSSVLPATRAPAACADGERWRTYTSTVLGGFETSHAGRVDKKCSRRLHDPWLEAYDKAAATALLEPARHSAWMATSR